MAGLLGFFLMSGRRNRREHNGDQTDGATSMSDAAPPSDRSEAVSRDVTNTQAISSDRPPDPTPTGMTTDSNENNERTTTNPFAQITPKQWAIAAVLLVGIPIIAYLGTFFLYPYAQDLIEGESPIDAILADYGVDEDAETQLLTIRRGDLVNSVAVNGTLEYANRERLGFGTSGTIDTIDVEIGDFVSEGNILMSLESEAIVTAEQNLQNASVALQDAEEKLDELINPDDQAVSEATLKVLTAYQSLTDAEDAIDNILEPSATDIANAELEIAMATAALDDANEKLSDLRNPSDIDLENARLEIAEAEKSLNDLVLELEDLTSQKSVALRAAELSANEAAKAHDDAIEAHQDILTIDPSAVNQAELDLEKAKLAVIEADAAVTDAQNALRDAEKNIGDEITRKKLEIAQAEAELAAAVIADADAREAYADAKKPFDEEEVADLQAEIADTEDNLEVAQNQLRQLEIETEAETRKFKSDLYEARNTYQEVFYKWIGMDISEYEWKMSPQEIFADIGRSPQELIYPTTYPGGLTELGLGSSSWVTDNPDTPWNEVVVATWNEFFPGQFRFDCAATDTSINQVCVNLEFDNAWDDLLIKTEAYETAMLANTQQFDNAEDAIDNAKTQLEDLQEQLTDALTPTDDETLQDLFAKTEVAYYTLVDAEIKLETRLEELERLDPELETRRIEAGQAVSVALEEATVARNNLADAHETLGDIKDGADEIEIAIAETKVNKAEADLNDAIRKLEDLKNLESPDIIVLNQKINAAEAGLQLKINDLNTLVNGDETQIALAQSELTSAQQDLNDKLTTLQDLLSPDQADIELAHQEIEVAIADLNAAEEDLNTLINPDPATIALRRAEVATAREELESAIAATQGTQIIAPFDGVIADISVEEGQTANPNNAAIVIADPSIVEISGTVDEVDVLFLQVDDPASIELEALGDEPLVGSISDIAAFGESNQGVVTYPVTIQTEQPAGTQLPEGLSAVAEVVIREQNNKLLAPIQALFGSVNDPILLISNDDGTLEPRSVTLGISDDFWTVIEDGVSEGETIIMTVVGADTSQFGGFGGGFRAIAGGPGGRN